MTSSGPLLSNDLAAFLESGVSLVVGTRDRDLAPEAALAAGLRVGPDRRAVTVFLPEEPAARTIENLRANGDVAVTASRPADYRTVQLKGRLLRIARLPEHERPTLIACRDALVRQLAAVGWAPELTGRLAVWPCLAADVEIVAVFDQTPGPRAGSPFPRGR